MAKNFTKKQVKDAILDSHGIVSVIAKKLGCAWHTAESYIKKHNLNQTLENENNKMIDFTESQLYKKIKMGDTTCIIFLLKTRAKNRGYIERQEVESKGELKINGELKMSDIVKAIKDEGSPKIK